MVVLKTTAFSQGRNSIFFLGDQAKARISFTGTSYSIQTETRTIPFMDTQGNIADENGNILMSSNGVFIADAIGDTMVNGDSLNPNSFTDDFKQYGLPMPYANLFLPMPDDSNKYVLFHQVLDYTTANVPNIFYTTVDITLNGGLGAVISKNNIIATNACGVGMAACKHANGRDWWVMVHRVNSNKFYKLLVTPTAILGPYSQNIGVLRQWDAGQAWFSPDGKKYAYYYVNGGLDIFDFDRCNGTLSNAVHVTLPFENGYNVGMAISPGSNALYISNTQHVYQFDLTAANIAASQLTVATYDSFVSVFPGFPNGFATLFGLSALAPDGKIYITTGNGTIHMHTIDNPDVIGLGCNVNQHSVQLPSIYFNTLPNHPNYFLGCDTTLGCTTCYTGVDKEQKNNLTARASPNPSNGIFTLQFDVQSTAGELEIFDVMGNMVWRDYVAPWSQYKHVDITKLARGVYLCKMKRKHNEVSVKVVKN